jgi:two-component system sensor histidine kinase SenX3
VEDLLASTTKSLPVGAWIGIAIGLGLLGVLLGILIGRRMGRRALAQRLIALGSRLGVGPPSDESSIEGAVSYLEQVTGAATEAVTESSADSIRFRRSLDTLPLGLVLCDENGAVLYRNEMASSMMMSRQGDVLAAQAVTELLAEAWDRGAAERILDLYGPPRRSLGVSATQIDDGRRPLGVIAVIEDISERKRLDEIRRDFIANVSHELKTPMGAMGLLSETLVVEKDRDVAKRLAERIHSEAFRVSRIIDDLLDLSRLESELETPNDLVPLNLAVVDAVDQVRSAAEPRQIFLDVVEPDFPVTVRGDRRQLVSALHALLENAITYSTMGSIVTIKTTVSEAEALAAMAAPPVLVEPEPILEEPAANDDHVGESVLPKGSTFEETLGETLTAESVPGDVLSGESTPAEPLSVESPTAMAVAAVPVAPASQADWTSTDTSGSVVRGRNVRISISDKGVGIPAKDLERIFERFYRVDRGRSRDTGGTGLGLAIVRHVAQNHGGAIEVESREGEGSTFTLVLPIVEEA